MLCNKTWHYRQYLHALQLDMTLHAVSACFATRYDTTGSICVLWNKKWHYRQTKQCAYDLQLDMTLQEMAELSVCKYISKWYIFLSSLVLYTFSSSSSSNFISSNVHENIYITQLLLIIPTMSLSTVLVAARKAEAYRTGCPYYALSWTIARSWLFIPDSKFFGRLKIAIELINVQPFILLTCHDGRAWSNETSIQ